ncbi:MAG: SseB family protein [Oscillospiraceae bacterium]|nr:SseB family protein [Oscillospiraceae bacterium]
MAEEKMDWLEDLSGLNKELEERILEANEDKTLIKWSKLLPDLMTSEILMVGQFTGVKNANGEDTLGILMLQKDGKAIVPFFTNPERIKALVTPEKNKFDVLRVNTARFFMSIKGKNAILNPFTPYSRVFSPFDIKILAAEYIDKAPPVENNNVSSENV